MAKVFKEEQEQCSIIATYYAIEKDAVLTPDSDVDLKNILTKELKDSFALGVTSMSGQDLIPSINFQGKILMKSKNSIIRANLSYKF